MESRKVVLMNLFAGKEWRCECRECICGYRGESARNVERSIDIYALPCVK